MHADWQKVKNNILLLVIGVLNDTDIHVNCGLFRKCKKSICQAKTVMSKEQVGGSMFAANGSGSISVVRTRKIETNVASLLCLGLWGGWPCLTEEEE